MAIPKRKRNKLLTQQHNCCNLCGHHFGQGLQSCYDEDTNTLLCRSCLMLLRLLHMAIGKNIDLVKAINYNLDHRVPA